MTQCEAILARLKTGRTLTHLPELKNGQVAIDFVYIQSGAALMRGLRVKCSCGSVRDSQWTSAIRSKSCGCLSNKVGRQPTRHGHSKGSPTYMSWMSMRYRCLHENQSSFARYGGSGIGICAEWLDFTNFLRDMGERPDGTTLDRIDNNRGYERGNCRWATPKEQNNNRRDNIHLVVHGETFTVEQAAARFGISAKRIYQRKYRERWDDERACLTPLKGKAA
jgi:hypothetical protein